MFQKQEHPGQCFTSKVADSHPQLPGWFCPQIDKKPIKQFIEGAPLDDAVKTAKAFGGDHKVLHKIKHFREFLIEADTKADIKGAPEKVRQEICWELKKIKSQVATLLKAAK